MGFLDTVFGRKKPTTTIGAPALAALEAELSTARERVRKADAALLDRIADMSESEHDAAVEEQKAAGRSEIRIAAQVTKLREIIEDLAKAEAAAAKKLRRDNAEKRLVERYPTLMVKYEALAAEMVAVLSEMAAIDAEVAAVNRQMREDHRENRSDDQLHLVETSDERFRAEPDKIEPDQKVVEKVWRRPNEFGRWEGVSVLVERNGKMVPTDPTAQLREVERVIPGSVTRGRRMSSPASNAQIPPARLGQTPFWPKVS